MSPIRILTNLTKSPCVATRTATSVTTGSESITDEHRIRAARSSVLARTAHAVINACEQSNINVSETDQASINRHCSSSSSSIEHL